MSGVIEKPAIYPSLEGRSVFITGGGSGIGESLVEHFCRQGAKVLSRCRHRRGRSRAGSGRIARQGHAAPHFHPVRPARHRRAARGRCRGAGSVTGRSACWSTMPAMTTATRPRRHRRLLGRPHAGEPAASVLRRAGGAAADARRRRRLDHQFRLDHLAGGRRRLSRLCDGQGGDQRHDPRACAGAGTGEDPGQLRAPRLGA